MNAVLLRRLLGAGVILLMLFIASLLLPAPSDPKPAEPGMRRIEVAVDDMRPITMPKADATAAPEEPQAAPVPTPSQQPGPSTPASRKAIAESAEAAAKQFSGVGRETTASPEVESEAVQEDDDIAAAPSAETSEEPPPKTPTPAPSKATAEIKPPISQRTPPTATAGATKPRPATSTESKPAPTQAPAATRPTTPAPAVTTAQTAPPKPVIAAPAAAPATTPPATSGSAKGPRWAVQAGSYADIGNARQVEAQLKSLGISSSISLTEAGGSARYRVRSGPYPTREAADAARARMQQNRISANVVPDGG